MRKLLSGQQVRITALGDEDLGIIEGWFNDVQFLRCYDIVPAVPKSQKEVRELLETYMGSDEKYIFAIRLMDSDGVIGILGFDEIIWSNRVATLFIGIGNPRHTAKGYGKEAMELLLDFGFNELNFFRIQLYVISYNEAAINLYESLGFSKEGVLRQFILRDGKRYDLYLYSLLQSEWK